MNIRNPFLPKENIYIPPGEDPLRAIGANLRRPRGLGCAVGSFQFWFYAASAVVFGLFVVTWVVPRYFPGKGQTAGSAAPAFSLFGAPAASKVVAAASTEQTSTRPPATATKTATATRYVPPSATRRPPVATAYIQPTPRVVDRIVTRIVERTGPTRVITVVVINTKLSYITLPALQVYITSTPRPTYTAYPSLMPLATHTERPTYTPKPTYTPYPTYTLYPSLTPTATATATETATATTTATETETATATATETATETETATQTATATETATATQEIGG